MSEQKLKRCTYGDKCLNPDGAFQPVENFTKNRSNSDGLAHECKSCTRARAKARYAKQRTDHEWMEKNRARQRELYHEIPPDTRYQKRRRWRINNPDKKREQNHRYLRTHVEYVRIIQRNWSQRNPDKVTEISQRRRSRKLELPSTFTASDWRRCLEYFKYQCVVCGRPRGLWHTLARDHWIPLSKGGAYTPDNIVPLCHGIGGCNGSKHDENAEEWLIRRFGKKKAKEVIQRVREYFDWVKEQDKGG